LGIQLEREADIKSKVKGAMLYPAIIISAMAIIGILMGIFVLPQLTSIFSEFEPDKLPATTKITRAYVGSCTGGKMTDFRAAAKILAGKQVKVDTFIVPATTEIARQLEKETLNGKSLMQIFNIFKNKCKLFFLTTPPCCNLR
jgi:homoaconitase/3-isopropylmalate dehydratase large subunit